MGLASFSLVVTSSYATLEDHGLYGLKAMAFVGLTERWDESVCLFHRMHLGALV